MPALDEDVLAVVGNHAAVINPAVVALVCRRWKRSGYTELYRTISIVWPEDRDADDGRQIVLRVLHTDKRVSGWRWRRRRHSNTHGGSFRRLLRPCVRWWGACGSCGDDVGDR